MFFGKADRLHHSFNDPAAVEGTDEKRLAAFRKGRDQLRAYLREFPQKDRRVMREIRRENFLYRFCTAILLLRLLTTLATL